MELSVRSEQWVITNGTAAHWGLPLMKCITYQCSENTTTTGCWVHVSIHGSRLTQALQFSTSSSLVWHFFVFHLLPVVCTPRLLFLPREQEIGGVNFAMATDSSCTYCLELDSLVLTTWWVPLEGEMCLCVSFNLCRMVELLLSGGVVALSLLERFIRRKDSLFFHLELLLLQFCCRTEYILFYMASTSTMLLSCLQPWHECNSKTSLVYLWNTWNPPL